MFNLKSTNSSVYGHAHHIETTKFHAHEIDLFHIVYTILNLIG